MLTGNRNRKCKEDLETEAPRYYRRSNSYNAWSFLFGLQPAPAYIGLLGCFLVLASASASWWSTDATFGKVAVAYAAPIIFVVIFLITKLARGRLFKRWWVELDPNVSVLIDTLDNLELDRPAARPKPKDELDSAEAPQDMTAEAVVERISPPEKAYTDGYATGASIVEDSSNVGEMRWNS
jgi:hypothetical protein